MTRESELERLRRVAVLAGRLVLETPKGSRWSASSYVRRELIKQIEEALVEAGYDMVAAREQMKRNCK